MIKNKRVLKSGQPRLGGEKDKKRLDGRRF